MATATTVTMKNDNLLGTNGKTGSTAPVILQQNHQHLIGTTTAQSYENGFRKNGHIGNGVTGETQMNNKQQLPKKKRRQNKADLGSNFIAPDGGWGWLVVIAAGVSNVSIQCKFIFEKESINLDRAVISPSINKKDDYSFLINKAINKMCGCVCACIEHVWFDFLIFSCFLFDLIALFVCICGHLPPSFLSLYC